MKDGIFLHQSAYIRRMLERYDMSGCEGAKSPMECGHSLCSPETLAQDNLRDVPYAAAIGSLLYCALATRPDIAHAMSILSKFTSEPRELHWNGVKRVFRYLKGTIDLGLMCEKTNPTPIIECYTDADWAEDQTSRKSMSGMITFFGTAPISYRVQQQPCVALSTAEAEYIAASDSVKELLWIQRFVSELDFEESVQSKVLCDNQSAIKLIKNPEFHRR